MCNKNLRYWLEGCVTFFKVFGSGGGVEYGSGEGELKVVQFIYNILFIMYVKTHKSELDWEYYNVYRQQICRVLFWAIVFLLFRFFSISQIF